jgi:hypothetical protein
MVTGDRLRLELDAYVLLATNVSPTSQASPLVSPISLLLVSILLAAKMSVSIWGALLAILGFLSSTMALSFGWPNETALCGVSDWYYPTVTLCARR